MQWNEDDLKNDVQYVLHHTQSLQEIHNALDSWHKTMLSVDWERLLEEKRLRIEAFLNKMRPCDRCKKEFARRDLHDPEEYEGFFPINLYCADCVKIVYEERHPICAVCDQRFTKSYSNHFCSQCRTDERAREAMRIISHNNRAESLNLPATLTVKQWLATLNFFEWKCAYCSCEYKGLEHYLPLSLGGGSTADNCLPSCKRCNTRKGDKHPSEFIGLFPAENIRRIQVYFATLVNKAALHEMPLRSLQKSITAHREMYPDVGEQEK